MKKLFLASLISAALSPCSFALPISTQILSVENIVEIHPKNYTKATQTAYMMKQATQRFSVKSVGPISKINAVLDVDEPAEKATPAAPPEMAPPIAEIKKSEPKKTNKGDDENPIGEDSTLFLEYMIVLTRGADVIYDGTVIIPDNVDYSLGARADGEQYSGQKLTKRPQGGRMDIEKTQRSQGWTLELNGSKEIGTGNIVSSIIFETFLQFNPLTATVPSSKESKKDSKKQNSNPIAPSSPPVTPILPDKLLPALYAAHEEVQQKATEKPAENSPSEAPKVPEGTLIMGPEGSIINSKGGTQRMVRAIAQKIGTNGVINDGEIQLFIKIVAVKPIPKTLQTKKVVVKKEEIIIKK